METQYIRVPSEQERANAAQAAIARHEDINTWIYAPKGSEMCCPGVIPLIKYGGGTIHTIRCPLCKREESWWGWETGIENIWNVKLRNERGYSWRVGYNFLSDTPDDAVRITWDAQMTSIYWHPQQCPASFLDRFIIKL